MLSFLARICLVKRCVNLVPLMVQKCTNSIHPKQELPAKTQKQPWTVTTWKPHEYEIHVRV